MLYKPTYVDMCVLELSTTSEAVTCFTKSCSQIIRKNYLKACNLFKEETPTQVVSCEFCEIIKSIFFHRASPETASATSMYDLHYKYLEENMMIKPLYLQI